MAKARLSVTVDPVKLAQARALLGTPTVSEFIAVALDRLIIEELERRHVGGSVDQGQQGDEDAWAAMPRDPSGIADEVDWAALYGVERTG
ncbi:MAG: hypothetical protein ACRDZW_04370 [Acidimicrobiales bacterium]